MFKVGLDAVNKSAQFKLKDNVSAITLFIVGQKEGDDTPKKLNFSDIGDNVRVNIDLIRKNQPNVTLVDLPLAELSKVVDILYRGKVQNTIPVASSSNLVLSDDSYLLVTLEWKNITITKLDVFENRVIGDTTKPLSIKAVDIDEQTEVNTEFYTAVVFGEDIESLETVRTDIGDDGVAVSQKQEMSYDYMRLLSDEEQGVIFATDVEQKVKFFGAGKVYLLQI